MKVKRGSGHKSNFLACKSCQQKWHFNCLPLKFDVLAVARKKYKCPAFRYCRVCGTKGKDLAICSECVYSYHRDCHDPPLAASSHGESQWKCHGCEFGTNNHNNYSASKVSGRKSHRGRKRRAQSDPAGQEQSPPAKQANFSKNRRSSQQKQTALEPATKNGEPKEEENSKKRKSRARATVRVRARKIVCLRMNLMCQWSLL
ncbi:uncharacterized protein LOC111081914 [Drosophila obscura]|uniref:uncharacterized protein LOC111081914 n=1 Tax=Drosophila obscura TaxID=7282 RepID=UPI001BB1B2BF|nr:uncharacterized protein LOC111081914 [Drosophila obscura]